MRMPPTCLISALVLFLTCSTTHSASHEQQRSSGRGLRWGFTTRDLWQQLPSAQSQTRRRRRQRRRALKKEEDDWHGNDDRQNFAWSTPSPTTVPFFVVQPPPPPTPVAASTPAPQQQPVPAPPVPDNATTPGNPPPDDNSGNENGTDSGSTTTFSADREQVCRAAARGKPLTTDVVIDVNYSMDVQLASASASSSSQTAASISPIYAGMTVNAAVTDFLTRVYIDRYCFDGNTNNRHLQSGNTGNSVTTQLDGTKIVVWGVTGGTTQRSAQPCATVATATEETAPTTCVRLETSNRIFLGSNVSSVSSLKDIATSILQDISVAFYNGAVMKGVQDSGDAQAAAAIIQTTYVSGSYGGDESANGESTNKSSNGRDGLRPAGKAFLTLFLLGLIGVACFAGYKYGYPKFREHQWRRKHNASDMATTPTTSRGGSSDGAKTPWSLPSMESIRERVLPRRGGGASDTTPVHSSDEESSVRSLYNETALLAETDGSSSRQKRSDEPNIVIAEATGSPFNSPDEFGTEMILDDLRLQQPDFAECGSTIEFTNTTSSFRFSPTKLNKIEERRRKDETMVSVEGGDYNFSQDAFSFSDINIVVDDSSSVGAGSSAPYYLQAVKRSYNVPDTVNL
jgi:hypothetical protein